MSDDFVFATVATCPSPVIDVIFIHGLTGDPVATWKAAESTEPDGAYWPKWIANDVPGANVYALGYPASVIGQWASKEMDLFERTKATLDYMASYSIGKRPIVLVTHSLGGLLAKQIIRTGLDASQKEWADIAGNCKLVFFLATPNTGSSLASILQFVIPHIASNFADLLKNGNDRLDELNFAYKSIAGKLNITTIAFYEMYKTAKLAFVVDKQSADSGVAEAVIPVDADHISICKPSDRQKPVYRGVVYRIRSLAEGAPRGAPQQGPSGQTDRNVQLVQVAMTSFMQNWLSQASPGAAKVADRINSGDAFDQLSGARKNAIAGKWEGLERQTPGPDGVPFIEYPVFLDIEWDGNEAKGHFRFVWKKDGVALVDETLPIEGGFFERFLLLNFKDTVSGKMQFGSLLLELSDDSSALHGVDVGVGYTTKKIVTGELTLHKVKVTA